MLFALYWNVLRFERVRVFGLGQRLIDEYRQYYHRAVFRPNTMPSPFGSSRHDVYFVRWSGQRARMVERIESDIHNELDELIERHSDIFYRYEISDDFRSVRIYETSSDIYYNWRWRSASEPGNTISRINSLIGLYHYIKEGDPGGLGRIITFVESQ